MTLSKDLPDHSPALPKKAPASHSISMRRVRTGLIITLLGFFVFLLGVRPSLFGLDRSPVIGFVQIAVFLVGLAVICVGGYICLAALWNNTPRSIAADIGLRLVSTGYVIAVFAGMADIFGFNATQHIAAVPSFGPWQVRGLEAGEAVIALGFLLLLPIHMRASKAEKAD
jgi:hypothetical protein